MITSHKTTGVYIEYLNLVKIQSFADLHVKIVSHILIVATQLVCLWLAVEEYFYFLKFLSCTVLYIIV